MSREWDALAALKAFIPTMLDPTPQPDIVAAQVAIGYPDEDRMAYSTMFFIIPEGGSWEPLTTQSLLETINARLYIIIKPQAAYTSMELMIKALFDYFAALSNAMVTDPTISSAFDEARINNFDFYPAIEGVAKSVGLDISLTLQFERTAIITPGDVYPSEDAHPIGG